MADIISSLQAAAGNAGAETDENFNQTVLLLHGDGSNGAQNNTFLDSSSNGFTITRNGNTTQGTFSPFSAGDGRWSNYIDGSGDYLSLAGSTDFDFGTGDFTISCWVYFNSYETTAGFIVGQNFFSSVFQLNSSGQLQFYSQPAGAYTVTGSTSLPKNEWVHVAVTRSGNTFKVFLNGSVDGTGTNSSAAGFSSSYLLTIAAWNNTAASWKGYIANFSILKGTAIDFASTGVPTSPLSTSTTNQKLLTCYGNRFADANTATTAKTITVNGNPKVTPFSPFAPSAAYDASVNGGSGYFPGDGQYLTTDPVTLSGDFCVEAWVYTTTPGTYSHIFSSAGLTSGTNDQTRIENGTGSMTLVIDGTATINQVGTAVTKYAWNHLVYCRSGTGTDNCAVFCNGVRQGTGTSNGTPVLSWIGERNVSSAYMLGYMSDLRVVSGDSVYDPYSSTLTVPTAPLTVITGTELLCNFTNAGIFDNTGKNNLETVGNAQIDTTTKKYGTGSMEFDGTGDYLLLPANDVFSIGVNENFTIEFWIYPTSSVANQGIMGTSSTTGIYTDSSGYIYLHNGSVYINPNTANYLTLNTWQHIAIVRSGGNTVAFYKDGVASGSYAGAFDTEALNLSGLNIGRRVTPSQILFTGFIDDLRITRGVARYTTTFTPPTAPFLDQ